MGMFKAPSPPAVASYQDVSGQQTQLNQQAMQQAFGLSAANQQNPYGSLTYNKNADGTYTANQQLSAPQQALLNTLQQNQQYESSQVPGYLNTAAMFQNPALNDINAGQSLINPAMSYTGQAGSMIAPALQYIPQAQQMAGLGEQVINNANYGAGTPDFSTQAGSLTSKQMDAYTKYNQPYYTQQLNSLDAQLKSQGLVPGDTAYENQMRTLRDTQSRDVSMASATFEPQAYQQAVTQYQMPAEIGNSLIGDSSSLLGNMGQILQGGTTLLNNQGQLINNAGNLTNQAGTAAATGATFANTAGGLQGMSSPASLMANLWKTPQASANPANEIGAYGAYNQAANQQYQNQMNIYGDMIKGMFGLGSAAISGGLGGGILSGIQGMNLGQDMIPPLT